MKGPYAMTVVNESVQREQQGWGPFARKDRRSKKGDAGEIVQESAGEPQRHFKLLSLSKSSYFALREPLTAILNSWTAMATSLSIALPSGGPTAVVWGLIVSFLGNLAMSASLAEM
jgi:choline transport protein